MRIYGLDRALRDFDGTNGKELSIQKWESIIGYLKNVKGSILTNRRRNYLNDHVVNKCGLCLEYYSQLGCYDCPLADGETKQNCCPEFFAFTSGLLFRVDVEALLLLAREVLNEINSIDEW